jgi:N-acetylglucosamine-6-sulfatase
VDGAIGQILPLEELYMGYARSLAAIDDSTGRVLDALERKGISNDTLVVYMGDNGYLWGEHGLIDKRSMHDPSIRVPLIASCPDLFAGGARRKQFALNIDIGPTLLDVAGVKAPASMHGQSLLPMLRNAGAPGRREFLYEYEWERDFPYTPTIYGLRTEKYSLMQYYGIWDTDELYDNEKDPHQMNNLVGKYKMFPHQRTRLAMRIDNPELKKLMDGLQERMENLLRATGGDPRFAGREIPGAAAAL